MHHEIWACTQNGIAGFTLRLLGRTHLLVSPPMGSWSLIGIREFAQQAGERTYFGPSLSP